MRINKTYMAKALAATILTAGFTACATEELADMLDSTADGGRLSIVPELLGSEASHTSTATRATTTETTENGVDALNENNLGETLDVFIAGGGIDGKGSYWNQYHLTKDAGASIQESVADVLSYNCLGEAPALVLDHKYRVYVAVNNAQTNGNIADEAALKALRVTDADICRHEGSATDAGEGTQTDKRFMMDYYEADWSPQAGNAVHQIQAQLSRAAVKFRVKIKFDADFYKQLTETDDYRINSPAWRLFNYNTSAPVFAGGDAVAPTLATAPRFSLDKTENDEYELVTYSYPFSWTKETADDVAPSILFSFDLVENGKMSKGEYHYYRIPLTNLTALQRNHLYEVTATIKSYGSSSEMVQTNDVDLQYKVVDWTDEANIDIEAKELYYLQVDPDEVVFHADGDVEKTLTVIAPQNIIDANIIKVKDYSSWYYDKMGKKNYIKKNISNPTNVSITGDQLTVKSSTADSDNNHAVIFIEFTVYYTVGGVTYSQKVYVRHFPVIFIQGIAGRWSSRTDTEDWVDWDRDHDKSVSSVKTVTFGGFTAKYFESSDSTIYTIKSEKSNGAQKDKVFSTESTFNNNNYMAVFQLTTSNSEYITGKVSENNDKVTSPAFMFASRLGQLKGTFLLQTARTHCENYIEVGVDGTRYTGWRLPTLGEAQLVATYQSKGINTIDNLLPAAYYWLINGNVFDKSNKKETTQKTSMSIFARCVRDLTPEEVETVNNRKE